MNLRRHENFAFNWDREQLMAAANTSFGLRAVPEPARGEATTDQAAFV